MIYKHPHDEFNVIDNSGPQVASSYGQGPVLLVPFVSEKGIDSKIMPFNDKKKCMDEYGYPDMKRYGQSYYHAINWLENGCPVRTIRLTAKDATYSNVILLCKVKIREEQKKNDTGDPLYKDPTTDQETTIANGNIPIMVKKASYKIYAESLTTLNELESDLETLLRSKFDNSVPNEITVPLFLFVCKGRGTYGDRYRFRFTPHMNLDKESNVRNYVFELLLNEGGLKKVEIPLNVSTSPYGRNEGGYSTYLEDVVQRNIYPIHIVSVDDYYDVLTNFLLPVIQQEDDTIKTNDIDYLFLRNRKGAPYKYISFEKDNVDLSLLEGYPLAKGSDGEFALTNPDRQICIQKRYEDFYHGSIDPSINDKKKHHIHFALDANLPLEVKNAMRTWRSQRNDLNVIFDSGLMNTELNLKIWRTNEFAVSEYGDSIRGFNYCVFDQYTGRDIRVTDTFGMSIMIPKAYNKFKSLHVPIAGVDFPLDFIIPGTIRPVLKDETVKTELYDLRINYIDEEQDKIVYGNQLSSYTKESDLADLNSSFMLYEILRDLAELGPQFRFKFNDDPEDIKNYNRIASQKLDKYRDGKVKYVEADVERDRENRKKLNTKVRVAFRTITEINDFTVEVERG